jgi:hypothetical protein
MLVNRIATRLNPVIALIILLFSIDALNRSTDEAVSEFVLSKFYNFVNDSAAPQSTQWITNAAYNQRSLQSTPLFTV